MSKLTIDCTINKCLIGDRAPYERRTAQCDGSWKNPKRHCKAQDSSRRQQRNCPKDMISLKCIRFPETCPVVCITADGKILIDTTQRIYEFRRIFEWLKWKTTHTRQLSKECKKTYESSSKNILDEIKTTGLTWRCPEIHLVWMNGRQQQSNRNKSL